MTDAPTPLPPGWYPNPNGGGEQLYWDGREWHVAPLPAPPAMATSPQAPPAATVTPHPEQPTATKVKCFKCQQSQLVPAGAEHFTCENCGQKLKRKVPSGATDPTPIRLQVGGEDDEEAPPRTWVSKHGGPLAVLALGLLLALLSGVTKVDALGTVGLFAIVGAGVYWLVNNRSQVRPVPSAPPSTTPQPDEVRQHQLQDYLSQYIATTGARVESVTPFSAVVVRGQKVNHVLHLLISIFLCGLWLPVWLFVALTGGEKRTIISVDRCGNVAFS